jgi:hypothetical protein
MARSLYRFYLYFVSYILLWFAGAGLVLLLMALLEPTGLQSTYNFNYGGYSPSQTTTVQETTIGIILLVVAGGLLGLHYWLFRRDVRGDAEAGGSGIRSFFLNLAQYNAALIVLFAGLATAHSLWQSSHGDLSAPVAITLTGALVFLLVQLERQRSQPRPGAPVVFQRLHIYYAGQIVILWGFVATTWIGTLQDLADAITQQGRFAACSAGQGGVYYPCGPQQDVGQILSGDFAALGLATLAWLVYMLLARGDARSAIRQTTKLLGLAFGTAVTLAGIFQVVDALLRGPAQSYYPGYVDQRDQFVAPLVFGLVVLTTYVLSLRADAAESPLGSENTTSSILAITALVAAAPFWWGCGRLLRDLIEVATQGLAQPDQMEWAGAIALIIAGVAYIPLALTLARISHQMATPGPRRGFALGLLAAGVITGATGLVMTVYAVVTNALNAPLDNWQEVMKSGIAVTVIGLILAGIYGAIVVRDGYIKPLTPVQPKPAEAEAPTPAGVPSTIEDVLDALLAQRLTRDEAAARIRDLTRR